MTVVCSRHGGSVEDTGEWLRRVIRTESERIPKLLRHLMGRYRFSRMRIWQFERAARRSQPRRYPGDRLFEVVEGDGKTFDTGIDHTECGIVRFLDARGANELTPFICHLDYVLAEAMGYGLRRTKTLSGSCDRCDFRLTKGGLTTAPWPSRFVELGVSTVLEVIGRWVRHRTVPGSARYPLVNARRSNELAARQRAVFQDSVNHFA